MMHHRSHGVLRRGMPGKMVRRREKESFQSLRVGREVADGGRIARGGEELLALHEALLLEKLRDVKHRIALGHGHDFFEDLAGGNRFEYFARGLRMVEEIFPGLQWA